MKVVDTQVMLHRVTDYAKDSSLQQKRNDFQQQMVKDQIKQDAMRVSDEVIPKDKDEAAQVVTRDGGSRQEPDQEKKKGKQEPQLHILDERNPLLADMALEPSPKFREQKPRIDIDI